MFSSQALGIVAKILEIFVFCLVAKASDGIVMNEDAVVITIFLSLSLYVCVSFIVAVAAVDLMQSE